MNREERTTTPITLPEVDADVYQYAFRRLPPRIETLTHNRVFSGPLRWSTRIEDNGQHYRIELSCGGGWDEDARKYADPWVAVVDHAAWTERRKVLFRDEFESAAAVARRTGATAQVYILGLQNDDQLREIVTAEWRFVAVVINT